MSERAALAIILVAITFALTACTHQLHCLGGLGVFRVYAPAGLIVDEMTAYGVYVEYDGLNIVDASSGDWLGWMQLDRVHGREDAQPPAMLRGLVDPEFSIAAQGRLAWHPASGGPGSFRSAKRSPWGVAWVLDPTGDANGACLVRLDARTDLRPEQERALRQFMEKTRFEPR